MTLKAYSSAIGRVQTVSVTAQSLVENFANLKASEGTIDQTTRELYLSSISDMITTLKGCHATITSCASTVTLCGKCNARII